MSHTRIIFLVLPQVHLIDLAGPVQVFHEAIDYDADLALEYCSTEENVVTSAAMGISALKHFSHVQVQPGDYVFIPGANVSYLLSRELGAQTQLFDWISNAHARGAYICSVCTGAFLLARCGLLQGRRCTTHWKRTAELKAKFPGAVVVDDILFTEDDRIYTSAGVTAGVDLALHILSTLADENIAYKVARELVVYLRRKGAESQESIYMKYRNHIHSGIHKVQDYLHENISERTSLSLLADQACMSVRNLTRTFKRETGITVNEYTILLRKELLRRLSADPDITRKKMAKECGLRSERQVIRLLNSVR